MKIFGKRIVAFAIDCIVYLYVVGILVYLVPFLRVLRDPLFYLLLFYPISMRDFLFKGASLGKKIMGIRIYDRNWGKPSYSVLFRRSHFTTVLSFDKYQNYTKEYRENTITVSDIINAERNKFGTRVVDKKVFKKLSAEAKLREGRWEDNMSEMYDAHIAYIYQTKKQS